MNGLRDAQRAKVYANFDSLSSGCVNILNPFGIGALKLGITKIRILVHTLYVLVIFKKRNLNFTSSNLQPLLKTNCELL